MYLCLSLGLVLVISRALIRDTTAQFVLTAVCVCVMGAGMLLLVYGVRMYIIFFDPKQNESLAITGGSGSVEFSTDFRPE